MKPTSIVQRQVLARKISAILHNAVTEMSGTIDPRTLKTLRDLVWAIAICGTTCLKELAQALFRQRRARTVKNVETALSKSLKHAPYDETAFFRACRRQVLGRIPSRAYERYRRLRIIIEDPTTYEKRTRRGKAGLAMEHPSQLKDIKYERYPKGYVDAWAGPLLKGRRWLPLSRARFSNTHPEILSQNQVEEAALEEAISLVGAPALVIGDRGLSRKAKFAWLQQRGCHALYRMRRDFHVWFRKEWRNVLEVAERLPFLRPATWKEGSKRRIRGQITAFYACLEKGGAGVPGWFLIFWPEEGGEPLILAATLPVRNLLDAQDLSRLYEKRWAIETGFQQMKGSFGPERFMVRAWRAVERMLNLAALAYLVLLLLLHHDQPEVQELRDQARQLLARESVWKGVLTVGKLHESLSLAFREDRHAWLATLL
jgi:hypothetical protein